MAEKSTPIRATCHCGRITLTVPGLPDELINHCQCSICRRYGAAWGYYPTSQVKIEAKPDAVTRQYIWGDREISFNFCDNCGCMCYWWPLQRPAMESGEDKMGVNTNNMNPEALRFADRKYEYSWAKAPLASAAAAHPDDLADYGSIVSKTEAVQL